LFSLFSWQPLQLFDPGPSQVLQFSWQGLHLLSLPRYNPSGHYDKHYLLCKTKLSSHKLHSVASFSQSLQEFEQGKH